MAWCTYPMNETLVDLQLSLHQLHHRHPSHSDSGSDLFVYVTSHVTSYKTIAVCIERTNVLRANTMRVIREYKAGEGML